MRNLTYILIPVLLFSLIFGVILTPLSAQANIIDSILGNLAFADNTSTFNVENSQNSQNMMLLQASPASLLAFQDKKSGLSVDIDPDTNVNILSDNALLPIIGPLGASDSTDTDENAFNAMSIYVVRKGDSLSQIAEMYEVSVNTILWANDMKKGDKLKEGDILFILPVSGVKHIVAKGESFNSISKKYKVNTGTILEFNGISKDTKLAVGDELIIPDAQMPSDDVAPKSSSSSKASVSSTLKNIAGYFINPVPELKRRSQNLHGPGNRGVDLAAPTGTRILASAPGKVLLARNGYNGGYGNMVIIEHPNGTKTLYGHMSKVITTTGAQVERGELIGLVGSTGRSTGPHLHFEVFNAKNPGSDWSWAKF